MITESTKRLFDRITKSISKFMINIFNIRNPNGGGVLDFREAALALESVDTVERIIEELLDLFFSVLHCSTTILDVFIKTFANISFGLNLVALLGMKRKKSVVGGEVGDLLFHRFDVAVHGRDGLINVADGFDGGGDKLFDVVTTHPSEFAETAGDDVLEEIELVAEKRLLVFLASVFHDVVVGCGDVVETENVGAESFLLVSEFDRLLWNRKGGIFTFVDLVEIVNFAESLDEIGVEVDDEVLAVRTAASEKVELELLDGDGFDGVGPLAVGGVLERADGTEERVAESLGFGGEVGELGLAGGCGGPSVARLGVGELLAVEFHDAATAVGIVDTVDEGLAPDEACRCWGQVGKDAAVADFLLVAVEEFLDDEEILVVGLEDVRLLALPFVGESEAVGEAFERVDDLEDTSERLGFVDRGGHDGSELELKILDDASEFGELIIELVIIDIEEVNTRILESLMSSEEIGADLFDFVGKINSHRATNAHSIHSPKEFDCFKNINNIMTTFKESIKTLEERNILETPRLLIFIIISIII